VEEAQPLDPDHLNRTEAPGENDVMLVQAQAPEEQLKKKQTLKRKNTRK